MFVILQICFATRAVRKVGEYPRKSPVLTGDIRSRDTFKPIAREQKYLINHDSKYAYIL